MPQVGGRERRWAGVTGARRCERRLRATARPSSAVMDVATNLSDAIVDAFLGYYVYWPHCPTNDRLLAVGVES